jgi:TolB-like protein/Tfp pilus assembly protein PilF
LDGIFQELQRRNVIRVAVAYIVVGWLVAQVADLAADAFDAPSWVMRMLIVVLLLGLPVALFLAWAFELTPEGVKKATELPANTPKDPRAGRRLNIVIMVTLAILVGWLGWEKVQAPEIVPVDETVTTEHSIAVLPFSDLSAEGDQVHFSEGIAEEILNLLVAVDGLTVTSRTSSFQFRNRDIGVPEIAEQLKVRYVLEGSVRKSGDTIRVTGQLIDATKDVHLWSQTFDRPLTAANLFAIQDEISSAIVKALGETLGVNKTVAVKAVTDDVDAYALYLEARPLFHDRRALARAEKLLAKAVELDPNFAKAWELRGAIQGLVVEYGENEFSPEESDRRSVEFAERALELDPNSATAIATLALREINRSQGNVEYADWSAIIKDLTRAIELDPRNGSALNWRGLAHTQVGRSRDALADFETCARIEPYYTPCRSNRVFVLIALGRDDEAMDAYRGMASDGTLRTEFAPLELFAARGEKDLFMAATNSQKMLYSWRRHEELYAAFQDLSRDHTELGKDILKFAAERGDRSSVAIEIAVVPLGIFPNGISSANIWVASYQRYRHSPKFRQMMRDMGVVDYWQKHGFPPQCKAIAKDDFECD